jgi:hypothetical protein
MDDFPAGPARPRPRGPALSVVIPVRDGGGDFERCLRGLSASTWTDFELVVVDDASRDGSGDRARAAGARVLRNDTPRGPAASRNDGAIAARSDLIFFVDADVVVHPDTLARVVARFEADPGLAALFGSYDDQPAAPGLVSVFRNLLHHDVHQQGDFVDDLRPAHTFWTGCGAIRRGVFLDLGGFDPRLYRRPAIEDIELGYRLTRAGHRVALARDVQATHLKRWTFGLMIRTDILQRGVPWMILLLRSGRDETDLNVSPGQRASVAATGLALAALAAAPWQPAALLVAATALAVVAVLNRGFYGRLAAKRGAAFALASFPLHLAYFFCCGASVALALGLWVLLTREPDPIELRARAPRADSPVFPRPRVLDRRPAPWARR